MAKREVIAFPDEIADYKAAALHTAEDPDRLAWLLDNSLGTKFWLVPESFIVSKAKESSEHAFFHFQPEQEEIEFWLIADAQKLLNSKPRPDFLLIARGENAAEKLHLWLNQLKPVQAIHLAYELSETNTKRLHWMAWLPGYTSIDNPEKPGDNLLITDV